jgi:protein-S-isoprenylcysteine O-methyltransferase Ste14
MFLIKLIAISVVSTFWFISELILNIAKFSRDKTQQKDKGSFIFINATIWIAFALGIFVYVNGLKTGLGVISFFDPYLCFLGLIVMIFGVVIRRTAISTLKKQFTVNVAIVEDHKIIDSGIYRHIRHPAYLGSLLAFLGLSISYQNWICLLQIFVPILVAFLNRISVEEKVLTEHFGEAYIEYTKRSNRLIPKLW